MQKHEYCCQNSVQQILDFMIPIPEFFKVDGKYLYDCDEYEFISGFKNLSDIISDIYKDIIKSPDEYGFSLIPDIDYSIFNPKANQSSNYARSLMSLLKIIGRTGELINGELTVSLDFYNSIIRTLKPKYKIPKPNMIIKKLFNFGFFISDFNGKNFNKDIKQFVISYPDNPIVIKALKGYTMTEVSKFGFFSLHYYLVSSPDKLPYNQNSITFGEYLKKSGKEFFNEFDRCMQNAGYTCLCDKSYEYVLAYFKDVKDYYIIRLFPYDNMLEMKMRLKNVGNYIDYIETLPPHIKEIFMTAPSVNKDTNYNYNDNNHDNIEWFLNGKQYYIPAYDFTFNTKDPMIKDIPYYLEIIRRELLCR
ncbi:MAG: hypothetical protein K0S55_1389 [Clostridia bacterium]|nr:hypothetical protein [Clostridia bacterium]